MGPNRLGKHAKAQNKVVFSDRALKVFLSVVLVLGFVPIAKDTAAAVSGQEAGGFVAADSLVGGVSDSGANPDSKNAQDEATGVDAEAASAGEDEAVPDVTAELDDEGFESTPPAVSEADASEDTQLDSTEELPSDSVENEADSQGEGIDDAQGIEEVGEDEESYLEGPENSFRYVDGVPIADLEASTYGMRRAAPRAIDPYPTWDKSFGQNKYVYINSSGQKIQHTVSGAKAVGIDVSEHQGVIDWAKVKADGIRFAIIRVGYGSDYTAQDDKYFLRNVEGARANGIAIGVYLYSYAMTPTGATGSAQSEAKHVIRLLEQAGLTPNSLALPVYLDMEQDASDKTDQGDLSPEVLGNIAETFCNAIMAKGYKVGIYSNPNWWTTRLTSSKFKNSNWSRWVAEWGNHDQPTMSGDLWQFSSKGAVNGIAGNVDMNFSFRDFGLRNCWVKESGKTYYYGADGTPVRWCQKIDGSWYYFNKSGVMQTGWVTWNDDKSKSYFGSDGKALIGLQRIDGATYYFDKNTGRSLKWSVREGSDLYYFGGDYKMVTGWVTWNADKSRSYFGSNGKALKGLQTIGGATYYFNPSNARTQRWSVQIGSDLYYFNGNYQMVRGWVTWNADGSKSYFGSDGKALKGLQKISEATYYFNPSTMRTQRWSVWVGSNLYYFGSNYKMVTGWVTWNADKSKSYFGADGKALRGFNKIAGYTYYFNPSTLRSVKWSQIINGSRYYFDGNGRMHTGWLTWNADKSRSYFDASGRQVSGLQRINGTTYYFNPITLKAVRWAQTINGSFYYFNESYKMVTGWVTWKADGSKSYFDSTGKALLGWQNIGGKRYYFDSRNGHSVRGTQVIDGEKYYFSADSSLGGAAVAYANDNTNISFSAFSAAQYNIASASFKPSIKGSMNPSSYPKGTDGYYQFARLDQGYSGTVTAEQINAYIASTAAGRSGTLKGTGQYFINAAKTYNINEIYLLAHTLHETGWGTSNFAKGYAYNGKMYYNFYGIGAFDSNPNNARNVAVNNDWSSIEKGIAGAAKWINSNYIRNSYGQNTLYKMRWNYTGYAAAKTPTWQYATDPNWANAIAKLMAGAYKSMGISQNECGLSFLVPVFKA